MDIKTLLVVILSVLIHPFDRSKALKFIDKYKYKRGVLNDENC
jgi:hypothetical protein